MLDMTIDSMNPPTQAALIAIFSALVCMVAIPALSALARIIGLVDSPNYRKRHAGSIPLIGGIAIATAITITMWTFGFFRENQFLIIIASLLAVLGALDDKIDISPRYRLIVQVSVGLAIVYIGGKQIDSVGDLIGNGMINLSGIAAVIFTIMCSVGVFNSINMIDGIDGLASSLVLITAAALFILAGLGGDTASALVIASLIGACLAFLTFNLSVFGASNKVFLGDAGSLFLGFFLLWFFVTLTQGNNATLSPVVAGWLFGVPLVDTVSVIVSRLIGGQSPFAAGRDHIHHRLLDNGISAGQTLRILLAYHGLLVVVGMLCNKYPQSEPYLFWMFVSLTVTHFVVLRHIFRVTPVKSVTGKQSGPV